MHEIAALVSKVGLSAVPFASLAIDIGMAAVRFTNHEQTEEFLDRLAQQVDAMKVGRPTILDELLQNQAYQCAVSDALRKMQVPRTSKFLEQSARACARIAELNLDTLSLGRILVTFDAMEPEYLEVLDAFHRYWKNNLTAEEMTVMPSGTGMAAPSHSEKLTELSILKVGKVHYKYCVERLAQLGCLADGDGGQYGDKYIEAYRVSGFGAEVRKFYFG
jgi:hypothetical protein